MEPHPFPVGSYTYEPSTEPSNKLIGCTAEITIDNDGGPGELLEASCITANVTSITASATGDSIVHGTLDLAFPTSKTDSIQLHAAF